MIIWTPGRTLDEVEKDVIFEALKYFRNNKVHTARALGICYKTLNNKLEQYNGTASLHPEGRLNVESVCEPPQKLSVSVQERKEAQEMPPPSHPKSDSKSASVRKR